MWTGSRNQRKPQGLPCLWFRWRNTEIYIWKLKWIVNMSLSCYWLAGGFSTQRVNYTERGFMSADVKNPSRQAFRKQLYRTMTLHVTGRLYTWIPMVYCAKEVYPSLEEGSTAFWLNLYWLHQWKYNTHSQMLIFWNFYDLTLLSRE